MSFYWLGRSWWAGGLVGWVVWWVGWFGGGNVYEDGIAFGGLGWW